MHWFVFSTLGEMNIKDVLAECQNQGWVPILVARTERGTAIPCFDSQINAIKFAKRNLPKGQIFGTTILTDEDLKKLISEWINGKGYSLEMLSHPRLMKDLAKMDIEIFEFHERPDVYGTWGSQCQNTKMISD